MGIGDERTNAGEIVKLVTQLLHDARRPMSTSSIQIQLQQIVRQRQIREPGEVIILLRLDNLPDLLAWMARKKMISNHTFYNRKEQYWSWGLNIRYFYLESSIEGE